MMFACCHPHLARENQLALTLKALCGFGNSEIARALLVGEETVKKRLQRATRDLVDQQIALDPPAAGELAGRLDGVHQVLYLLFNEGYSSSDGDGAFAPISARKRPGFATCSVRTADSAPRPRTRSWP